MEELRLRYRRSARFPDIQKSAVYNPGMCLLALPGIVLLRGQYFRRVKGKLVEIVSSAIKNRLFSNYIIRNAGRIIKSANYTFKSLV